MVRIDPLASVDDLALALGSADCIPANDPRANAALQAASVMARAIAQQTFNVVNDDVVDFQTEGPELWLPQRLVRAVASVEYGGCGGTCSDGCGCGMARVPLATGSYCWTPGGYMRGPFGYGGFARVTYSHGYDPIPDDVRVVVADMAARRYTAGVGGAVVASETIGSYSYTTRSPDGEYGMPSADVAVLKRYRPNGGSTSIRTPSATSEAYAGVGAWW